MVAAVRLILSRPVVTRSPALAAIADHVPANDPAVGFSLGDRLLVVWGIHTPHSVRMVALSTAEGRAAAQRLRRRA